MNTLPKMAHAIDETLILSTIHLYRKTTTMESVIQAHKHKIMNHTARVP